MDYLVRLKNYVWKEFHDSQVAKRTAVPCGFTSKITILNVHVRNKLWKTLQSFKNKKQRKCESLQPLKSHAKRYSELTRSHTDLSLKEKFRYLLLYTYKDSLW